jgi:hypothetical protein
MSEEISKKTLLKIIDEEIELALKERAELSEGFDHKNVAAVTNAAAKLLKALEVFEAKATDPMKNALVGILPHLKKFLEHMGSTPLAYVPGKGKRVIQLRADKKKNKD